MSIDYDKKDARLRRKYFEKKPHHSEEQFLKWLDKWYEKEIKEMERSSGYNLYKGEGISALWERIVGGAHAHMLQQPKKQKQQKSAAKRKR
jgi:hypothetical protein